MHNINGGDYLGVANSVGPRVNGVPTAMEFRTPISGIDAQGNVTGGDLTMSKDEVAKAVQLTQEGKEAAINAGSLPSGAKDVLATVEQRLNKHIDDWAKNYVKSIDQAGGSENDVEEARRMTNRIKVAAKKLAFLLVKDLENALNTEGEDVGGWRDQKRSSIRLWNAKEIQNTMVANPALGGLGDPNNMASGPVTQVTAGGNLHRRRKRWWGLGRQWWWWRRCRRRKQVHVGRRQMGPRSLRRLYHETSLGDDRRASLPGK